MSRGPRSALVALAAVVVLVAAPAVGRARTFTRLGPAPAAHTLTVELPLRVDGRGLAAFATAVSTPGSPSYRHYASVATLARRFGAPAATRARVVRYLRRAGASHVGVAATGLYASATMRVATADRIFGAAEEGFAIGGDRFVAPSVTARIPTALRGAVTGVVGLDTRRLVDDARPRIDAPRAAAAGSSAYPSRTGTPSGCASAVAESGFTPNEYLDAYGFSALQATGDEGQGEKVALIEIDGFKSSDVQAFAACFGLPVPKIDAYGVGIGKALPAGGESTLDLELLDATAPRLKEVDVYESQPVASQVLRSLTEPLAAKSRIPNVISASLSTCQPDAQAAIGQAGISTVESTLELAAASGVSVLAASGDNGSSACLTTSGAPLQQLAVNYPAASPWVTGVGGTNVHLSAANAISDPATDQVVWNDEPDVAEATGGGASSFPRPAYQRPVQPTSVREVPDVSMLADPLPGYEIYCTAAACQRGAGGSPWVSVGGTSAGTPLLAGGFALVDEQLVAHGQQPLGFANPLLYRVARSSTAADTISDVVTGSNDIGAEVFGAALGCCTAHPGYDEASGLGSVNVAGLAAAAAALVPRRVVVGLTLPAQGDELSAEHLLATVSCTTECLMGAYAKIRIGDSSQIASVYSSPYALTMRRRRTIRIGLPASVRTRIRAAFAAGQPVVATVYGAVIDASGAVVRETAGRTLTLS